MSVSSLLRYAAGLLPVEGYEHEYGKVGTPGALVADLVEALTTAIDAADPSGRRHQAPGQDRDRRHLPQRGRPASACGWSPRCWPPARRQDNLSYRALRTLAELDPAVAAVIGLHPVPHRAATSAARPPPSTSSTGAASRLRLPSRTDRDPRLRGTKHRAAEEREVTVAEGRSDGRTVILVPETKDAEVTGHDAAARRASTTPWRRRRPARCCPATANRYAALADAVTETEPVFDDELLATVPFVDLLTEPVYVLAERWRHGVG